MSATPHSETSVAVRAFAYCAKLPKPPVARRLTRTVGTLLSPRCPDDLLATAGGYRAPMDTAISSSSPYPELTDRGRVIRFVSDRWLTAQLDYPRPFVPLTTFAYCS